MRLIIAGSRTATDYELVLTALAISGFMKKVQEVVSGGAKGADKNGEKWAKRCGIPCKVFPADWEKYGKKAGYLRNYHMAQYANALLAIWDGQSKGTKNMIDEAKRKGLSVYVYRLDGEEDEQWPIPKKAS